MTKRDMYMNLRDNLIAAKALIDTPEKWKKSAGEAGYGTPCCAVIATHRVRRYGSHENAEMRAALYLALPPAYQINAELHGYDVGHFNDASETTHADIMALFDRAIEASP